MEFHDVVMRRRAVRRFEEGGVDRAVIERIARLAQRTPSAGFSQERQLLLGRFADEIGEMGRIVACETVIGELRSVRIAALEAHRLVDAVDGEEGERGHTHEFAHLVNGVGRGEQ